PPEPMPVPKAKLPEFQLPAVKVDPKPALLSDNKQEVVRPEAPKAEVRLNAFDGGPGSSAKPTVDSPAKQVQTGGFGDPNGMKADGRSDRRANIAGFGSFDMPAGPGAGNGIGGAK